MRCNWPGIPLGRDEHYANWKRAVARSRNWLHHNEQWVAFRLLFVEKYHAILFYTYIRPYVTSPMQFRLKASPVSSGAAKGIVIATVLAAGLIGAYLYRDHIRSSILNCTLLCAGVYCCGMELFSFILAYFMQLRCFAIVSHVYHFIWYA